MRKIITVFLIAIFISCSQDDNHNEEVCEETEVTMIVNDELQSFAALGIWNKYEG